MTASVPCWSRSCTQHSTTATCPGRASSIFTAAPPVCSQRCGSSGVSTKSLRSCLGRRCNSTLAASTTSRLQGGRHGILCAAWSRAVIPELSCSCRRPVRSSPTSLVIITTVCSTIPAHNVARRTFPVAVSLLWNSLPSDIQSSPSLHVFR